MNIKNTVLPILGLTALAAALSCPAATNGTLRAATYNIRLSCGEPGSNDCWAERRDELARMLRDLKLDVFGMQEVCPNQMQFLKKTLPEFAFVGEHRNADRKSGEASPVAYRKDRFEAEKSGTFWLSTKPDVPGSKSWGTACTRVCSYAILRDKQTGKRFCFANTHTDHVSAEAREKGMLLVIERMKEFGKGVPIIFTGDHNCTEADAPAKAVAKILDDAMCVTKTPPKGSWRSFSGWNYVEKEVPAAEAVKLSPAERNSAEWNVKCGGSRIDFIYVSRGTRVESYETVNAVRKSRKTYMSDHFPVVATLVLP